MKSTLSFYCNKSEDTDPVKGVLTKLPLMTEVPGGPLGIRLTDLCFLSVGMHCSKYSPLEWLHSGPVLCAYFNPYCLEVL